LEEFERQLSSPFFCYSVKKLPLYYSYLDWLVSKIGPILKQQIPENYLDKVSVSSNSFQEFTDRKNFLVYYNFSLCSKVVLLKKYYGRLLIDKYFLTTVF
jgi:hypothetical protein